VKLGKQKGPKSVKGIDMPNNMAGRLPTVQTNINQPYAWAINLVLFGVAEFGPNCCVCIIKVNNSLISLISLTSITDCLY